MCLDKTQIVLSRGIGRILRTGRGGGGGHFSLDKKKWHDSFCPISVVFNRKI